jgi:hypothetical protein
MILIVPLVMTLLTPSWCLVLAAAISECYEESMPRRVRVLQPIMFSLLDGLASIDNLGCD